MQPLIVPPQGAAPLDPSQVQGKGSIAPDDLRKIGFSTLWYIYFGNLQAWASAALGLARYGTSAQRAALKPLDVTDAGLYFETDTGLVYQNRLIKNIPTWVCIWGTQRIQMTLTVAGPTNINAPSTNAPRLLYLIDQDATGGRTIHWNTGFSYASDSLGRMTASTRSIFEWQRDLTTSLYVPVGQPLTDLT